MEPELLGHSYKTFIPFLPWHLLCTWSASLVCHQYRQYSVDYSAKAFCVLILKTSGDSMAKPVSQCFFNILAASLYITALLEMVFIIIFS